MRKLFIGGLILLLLFGLASNCPAPTREFLKKSGTANYLPKWDGSGYVDSVVVDNGGNVGIGTANPAYPLEISGMAYAQAIVKGTTAADFLMYHTGAALNAKWTGLRSKDGKSEISSYKDDGTYNKQGIIAWDNLTGNVGIGTLTPPSRFAVKLSDAAGADSVLIRDSNGNIVYAIGSNGTYRYFLQSVPADNLVTLAQGVTTAYTDASATDCQVTFTAPRKGKYKVTYNGTYYAKSGSNEAITVLTYFVLTDSTNTNTSNVQSTGTYAPLIATGSTRFYNPINVQGVYSCTAATSYTIKLRYMHLAYGGMTSAGVFLTNNASGGSHEWLVEEIGSQ